MWPETGNLQLVQGRRESAANMSQTDLPLTTHAQVFMYVIVLSRAGTPEIPRFFVEQAWVNGLFGRPGDNMSSADNSNPCRQLSKSMSDY